MCLLISQPQDVTLEEDALRDFYDHNKDGFGAVYLDGDKVEVLKVLGDVDHVVDMYNKHLAGKKAVIHFRMKTHGDIDENNVHPYVVIKDKLWMSHNGVLRCSNPADNSMSDTWHIIKYFLNPILRQRPEFLNDNHWQTMLGSMIGDSNKFAFMDSDGEVTIINKSAGVEHFGCWLSNTYAWTPSKFGYYSKYSSPSVIYSHGSYAKPTNPQSKYYDPYGSWYPTTKQRKLFNNNLSGVTDAWGNKIKKAKKSNHKQLSKDAYKRLTERVENGILDCSEETGDFAYWVLLNRHTSATWLLEHGLVKTKQEAYKMIEDDAEDAANTILVSYEQVYNEKEDHKEELKNELTELGYGVKDASQ